MCRQPRCIEVYYIVNKMKQTSMLFLRHFTSERNRVFLKKFHQIYAQCLDVWPPCNVWFNTYHSFLLSFMRSYTVPTSIAYVYVYIYTQRMYINPHMLHCCIDIIQKSRHFGAKFQVENGLLWSGPSVWWFQKSNCWRRTRFYGGQLQVNWYPFTKTCGHLGIYLKPIEKTIEKNMGNKFSMCVLICLHVSIPFLSWS